MKSKTCHCCTHKLVKCEIANQHQDVSIRYVKLEKFNMWLYMMQNRHGLSVVNKSLCLWVNADEYTQNQEMYANSSHQDAINMVIVLLYDEKNQFTFSLSRFVPSDQTEQMREILISHVNQEILSNDCLEVKVVKGYALNRFDTIDHFISGLSGCESALLSDLDVQFSG